MKQSLKVILATIAVVLISCEAFFRLEPELRKSTGINESVTATFLSVPTEFAPYTDGFNVRQWRSSNLNTNSLGFRTVTELGDSQERIFVLGGSTAVGWGASSDDTTFAFQLEKHLKQNGFANATIFNAGCDGFNSNQEWVLVATKIMDLNPRLVILFDGYNDLHYSMGASWKPEYNIYSAQVLEQISFHPWYLHSAFLKYVDSKTKLARVRKKYSGEQGMFRPEAVARYLHNTRKIAEVVASVGGRTLTVLQPHFNVSKKALTEAERRIFEIGHDVKLFPNYLELIERLYTTAQEKLKTNDSPSWQYVDGNAWFKDRTDHMFLDEVHLTDAGNKVVTDALAPIVSSQLTSTPTRNIGGG